MFDFGHGPLINIYMDYQKVCLPFLQTREALPIPVIYLDQLAEGMDYSAMANSRGSP
jgi:hypothetical protein